MARAAGAAGAGHGVDVGDMVAAALLAASDQRFSHVRGGTELSRFVVVCKYWELGWAAAREVWFGDRIHHWLVDEPLVLLVHSLQRVVWVGAALSEHPLWWLYFLFTGVLEMFVGERRQSEVGPSVVWAGAAQATSAVRELFFFFPMLHHDVTRKMSLVFAQRVR